MRKSFLFLAMVISSALSCMAQYSFTDMHVKDLHGESKPLKDFIDKNEGTITLFVFWKTCCPTNLSMIDSLHEVKEEDATPDRIKTVLVSVDDPRSSSQVLPVVRTKGWTDEVIMDTNMELARLMQVNIPPQWVAVDSEGNAIYRRKIMEGETDAEFYYEELLEKIEKK